MSTVIKVGLDKARTRRLSSLELSDHAAEAVSVVETAKRQAANLLAQAREQARRAAEAARAEGYQVGFNEGKEAGRVAGQQEAFVQATERFEREQGSAVAALGLAIQSFEVLKSDLAVAAEHDLLEFAVRLAQSLTYEIGRLDRQAAIENLRRALELVGSKTDLTIRVHPADLSTVSTFAGSLREQVATSNSWRFFEDDSIAPGGCRVEKEHGEVDATLETQVTEMVSLLLGCSASGAHLDAPVPGRSARRTPPSDGGRDG